MRVFVFAATKGGVGKSTLAACTAIAAQAEGETVVLVDYDPQRSLSEWVALRSGAKPELLTVPRGASLKAALKDVSADAVVIVDTPPGMVGIIEQAVMGADLVVIPIRPAPLDILAIDPIVELVEECKKPSVFVINQVPARTTYAEDTAKLLKKDGRVLSAVVGMRNSFAMAMAEGKTGPEKDAKAREEIAAVWTQLKRLEKKG